MSKGFVEEGQRTARGQPPAHIEWNSLDLGDGYFAMERPSSVDQSKRINQADIPFTYAYVRKQNKFYCQLCTMWFDRKSVGYKIPSHRIVDLQKKWNCHRSGRRYSNASYLYSFVDVCLFCSQFFQSTEHLKDARDTDADEIFSATTSARSNDVEIKRRDIALGRKVYQCSVVDGRGPDEAICPPYDRGGCRTRREVDPWWEVDLGRTQSVHSVSFTATGALQQKLHIYVILLRGPVGFENPFLDEVLRMSSAWHEFVFDESSEILEESRDWVLPENTFGGAVRVQIRGKNVLRLSRCQVFQGNNLPPPPIEVDVSNLSAGFEAESIDLDEMMRITSFAAQPVKIFDDLRTDSQVVKHEPIHHILDGKEKQIRTIKRVNILNSQYQARKARIEWWLDRARDSANFFTIDELMCFRDIIFVPLCNNSKQSGGKRSNKFLIPTHDLRGNSLMQHYPRCDYGDLIKQLKQVADWIQNRQHTRDINAFLVAPEKFDSLFHAENDLFERLKKVLVFLEETWNGSGRKLVSRPPTATGAIVAASRGKRATLLGQTGLVASIPGDSVVEPQVVDGASWSQVVMTMHLLCINDVENIPEYVFAIDEGLEMLFPLDHDGSDDDESEVLSEDNESQSINSSVKAEKKNTRSKVRLNASTSQIVRRTLSPPPPDYKNSTLDSKPGCGTIGPLSNRRPMLLIDNTTRKQPDSPNSPLGPSRAGISSGGGRRLASTLPLGISQIFQLSLLSFKDDNRGDTAKSLNSDNDVYRSENFTNVNSKSNNSMTAKNNKPTLLELTRDPRMPHLNFDHAQYKLNRLQKKSKIERSFPKTLEKDFPIDSPLARFQLETQEKKHIQILSNSAPGDVQRELKTSVEDGAVEGNHQATISLSDKSMSWDGDLYGRSMSLSGRNSPSHSFDDRNDEYNDSFFLKSHAQSAKKGQKDKNKILKYTRACFLCSQSFPKKAVDNKVMMKHIITIRKTLDPVLGNKFAAHLMQGLSPFNLVCVCEFCLQFFNPDMPNGVCLPDLQQSGNQPDLLQGRAAKAMDIFYDERYPGSMRFAGASSMEELHKFRENMSLTRARAKNAIDVARYISEAGTAEEEQRIMREQIEAQIKAGFGAASLRRSSLVTGKIKH